MDIHGIFTFHDMASWSTGITWMRNQMSGWIIWWWVLTVGWSTLIWARCWCSVCSAPSQPCSRLMAPPSVNPLVKSSITWAPTSNLLSSARLPTPWRASLAKTTEPSCCEYTLFFFCYLTHIDNDENNCFITKSGYTDILYPSTLHQCLSLFQGYP